MSRWLGVLWCRRRGGAREDDDPDLRCVLTSAQITDLIGKAVVAREVLVGHVGVATPLITVVIEPAVLRSHETRNDQLVAVCIHIVREHVYGYWLPLGGGCLVVHCGRRAVGLLPFRSSGSDHEHGREDERCREPRRAHESLDQLRHLLSFAPGGDEPPPWAMNGGLYLRAG